EEPHAVLESLGLDRAQVSIETLDPLPREDVAALIADAFAVEAAPRRAVEWAMERAGGSPGRTVGLIEELVRSGARTTDDGKLVLPRELPDTVALAGRREWGSVLDNLKGGIARRFALLQALPGAPSIAELESLDERHGENGDGGPDWRLALEELAARHLVERRFSDGEVRFAIPDTVREVEWSGRLSSDETTRVLER